MLLSKVHLKGQTQTVVCCALLSTIQTTIITFSSVRAKKFSPYGRIGENLWRFKIPLALRLSRLKNFFCFYFRHAFFYNWSACHPHTESLSVREVQYFSLKKSCFKRGLVVCLLSTSPKKFFFISQEDFWENIQRNEKMFSQSSWDLTFVASINPLGVIFLLAQY